MISKQRSSVSWDKEVLERLEQFRTVRGLDRSEVVNMAVSNFIDNAEGLVENVDQEVITALVQQSVLKVVQSKEFIDLVSGEILKSLGKKIPE